MNELLPFLPLAAVLVVTGCVAGVLTSLVSARSHHKRGAVDTELLKS
ncbi:MAG: hypothetical protein P8M28_04420 [Alphaproteobacteria bacterium]|jgi:uncharacterized membrane protein YfcA|nr:hypothetical protein [Alphaproteobacteria bacterium]